MELLKNKIVYYTVGIFFILASSVVFYQYMHSRWNIVIHGLQTLSEEEIESYVSYYLKENPEKISSQDIEQILKFHPRVESVRVSIWFKTISITIEEKKTGYLFQNGNAVSEVSPDGKILQELVVEKNHLSPDFPIFYLTAENDNEITTIKRDIIQLWEKTKSSHGFIWQRLSEFVLLRDEMGNPEIDVFHAFLPLKISIFAKMDINTFRKLWAILYLVETENFAKKSLIRIYSDHAVME
ncbi:MAG: FtsQ-type POTRA domain-containing protein [Spirochaetia bacterium]|nr:FtsQ-type POTRA domain-containing protein [Spirochaetia bacterium]